MASSCPTVSGCVSQLRRKPANCKLGSTNRKWRTRKSRHWQISQYQEAVADIEKAGFSEIVGPMGRKKKHASWEWQTILVVHISLLNEVSVLRLAGSCNLWRQAPLERSTELIKMWWGLCDTDQAPKIAVWSSRRGEICRRSSTPQLYLAPLRRDVPVVWFGQADAVPLLNMCREKIMHRIILTMTWTIFQRSRLARHHE